MPYEILRQYFGTDRQHAACKDQPFDQQSGIKAQVFAKMESLNPGYSVKDRIGISMIDAAEKEGILKKGGTIIEATSGNTGIGLALTAAVRGYKCIFILTDKVSVEKMRYLKSLGADIVVCPAAAKHGTPTIM
jgi:cystathionine beta-synthase